VLFCRFLCNPTKDVDLRKWAAEGLAYLTLDAEVKEELVEDSNALRSLFDLAKVCCCLINRWCHHLLVYMILTLFLLSHTERKDAYDI
jgi:hypothetical protein